MNDESLSLHSGRMNVADPQDLPSRSRPCPRQYVLSFRLLLIHDLSGGCRVFGRPSSESMPHERKRPSHQQRDWRPQAASFVFLISAF